MLLEFSSKKILGLANLFVKVGFYLCYLYCIQIKKIWGKSWEKIVKWNTLVSLVFFHFDFISDIFKSWSNFGDKKNTVIIVGISKIYYSYHQLYDFG